MDIYKFIWREDFWFPRPYTWGDLVSSDKDVYYPRIKDITLPSLLLAVVLLLFRYLFDRLILFPLGSYFNLKNRQIYRIEPHPVLEDAFKNKQYSDYEVVERLEKKTNFSKRYIQLWFHRRKLKDTPSIMQKMSECSWNFLFYFGAFVYGLAILWNKSWFSETKYCWVDWPRQHVTSDLYWFYLIELSYYWSQSFTLLVERKKKDFLVMIIHHIATVTLIYISWACNFVRFGSLVILVHDAVDYWLEAAKMAKYCKKQNLCEALFVIFVIVWFITRLGIFPFRLIYAPSYEIHTYVDPFPTLTLLKTLVYILQVLHLIWTCMIIRVALQKFSSGQIKNDVRSDTESGGESEEAEYEVVQNRVTHRTASRSQN